MYLLRQRGNVVHGLLLVLLAGLIVVNGFNVYKNNLSFPTKGNLRYDKLVLQKFDSLRKENFINTDIAACIKDRTDYNNSFTGNDNVWWLGQYLKIENDNFNAIALNTALFPKITYQYADEDERIYSILTKSPINRVIDLRPYGNAEDTLQSVKEFLAKKGIDLIITKKETLPHEIAEDFKFLIQDRYNGSLFFIRDY